MQLNTYTLASLAALLPLAYCAPRGGSGLAAAAAIVGSAEIISSDSNRESGSSVSSSSDSNSGSSSSSTDGPPNPSQLTCSATSNTAPVVSFAQIPAWGTSMIGCLGQINTSSWNTYDCMPNNGNGTVLGGVEFNFYKNGTKWNDPADCYTKCEACLTTGINKQQGVSTTCFYDAGKGSGCSMGFIAAH